MALSPASGALSQTQLAVLEQIRALRAAKATAPVQAMAPVPAPAEVKSAAAPGQPLATETSAVSANRPRGSILNITV
jgi:hypothetical protein